MPAKLNLKNKRFGKLICLNDIGKNKHGCYLWECLCDCGNKVVAVAQDIKKGHTKSCGCLILESITKHGLHGHPLYSVWRNIINRCNYNNKNNKNYKHYGGRGIKICDEWLNDFQVFYDWCVNNGWKSGLEIDRRNNNGNYEPSNCRFVTRKQNCRNTRVSKTWIVNNEKFDSVRSAAKKFNVSTITIQKWCGTISRKNNLIKLKPGCYAINKYK